MYESAVAELRQGSPVRVVLYLPVFLMSSRSSGQICDRTWPTLCRFLCQGE